MNTKAPPGKRSRHRCIVADDVRSARNLLGKWLQEMDVTAVLCADGKSALEAIRREAVDLVISDIEMPEMSGLDLIKTVRESGMAPNDRLRFVLVTGLLDERVREVAQGFGVVTVLLKPLGKSCTQQVIRRILAGQAVDPIYDSVDPGAPVSGGSAVSPSFRRLLRNVQR